MQMSGISAMRKCYSYICDEVALENTKTPFNLASRKNQALPDPYNHCIAWFQKVTLPRNNLQKYFANSVCAEQSSMTTYAVQMLCYILDTFRCGNQIFLSLDKYDGKEIGFTEVLVCGLLVWHKLIKW